MRSVGFRSKRCPRCDVKNNYSAYRCSGCGLIFSRVENGSNILAKEYILAGKKEYTVKAKMFPKDVSKKKFLLLCGFLGIFGAHNFYVGRYVKAFIMLILGLSALVLTALSSTLPNIDQIMSFFSVPIGIDSFLWVFDFIEGIFNKYKIPVAVDFKEEK